MDRAIWTQDLTTTTCPPWPCPICGRGCVALAPGLLAYKESAPSKSAAATHPDWEPGWTDYSFTAWGKCTHPDCAQDFAIAGKGGVLGYYHDPDEGEVWTERFKPLICVPMPKIIHLSDSVPNDLRRELEMAFELFWVSAAASAGRIRVACERLMDYVGIMRRLIDKNGDPYDLTLHRRIEIFKTLDSEMGSRLLAVKWLGNTASHDNDVTAFDVLDGLEIMEHALSEIVDRRSDHLSEVADRLAQRHKG